MSCTALKGTFATLSGCCRIGSVDNVIRGSVLTFLDVTAATRAELALRESEERFRMMAGAVPAFLFTASPELVWGLRQPALFTITPACPPARPWGKAG